jgi:hypothetical protein
LDRARRRIAHVAADDRHAGLLLLGRDVLLSVQQRIQHAHLAAGLLQLLDEQRADVAAATCDQRGLTQLAFLS